MVELVKRSKIKVCIYLDHDVDVEAELSCMPAREGDGEVTENRFRFTQTASYAAAKETANALATLKVFKKITGDEHERQDF